MKNDAIEWFYSCIRRFVIEYISNTNRDFTGEKIEEIIKRECQRRVSCDH